MLSDNQSLSRTRATATSAAFALLLCAAPALAQETEARTAVDLTIVDCLLPGQIRQLGNRHSYVSKRRPVHTTAFDCRVRGGEYVASDRANLASALRVWLERAQLGDAEAQTTVGEIFERGHGTAADFAAAAHWYERAADQGFARAQINLANLFELGNGVEKDPARAAELYRAASGLPDTTLRLEPGNDIAPLHAQAQQREQALTSSIATLQQSNAALETQLERARQAMGELRDLSANERNELTRALRDAEQRLQDRNTELSRLRASGAASAAQQRALAEASQQRAMDAEAAAIELRQTIGNLQERQSAQSSSQQTALHQAMRSISATESELERRLSEAEQLRARIARLETELAERASQPEAADPNALAEPSIAVIQPTPGPQTRGLVKVSLSEPSAQLLIGRVDAPAGLLSVSMNGQPVEVNGAGVFQATLSAETTGPIALTAVDRLGRRTDLTLDLTSDSTAQPAAARGFGRYVALLIGNNDYAAMPDLNTPIRDVQAISDVLSRRYGFETRILTNATRYQVLSALNDLRAELTSDDNLLIYYAGHGELDETNMRGHWLPIDAEADSTANWLSNVDITDIVNVINAKHVLLVADSCYSGTLTRSSLSHIEGARTERERKRWLRALASKRARVVLTSGGLAPVLDAGGGGHSVFAAALLDTLRRNNDIVTGRALHQAISARVSMAASEIAFEQLPEYAPIARAGHEAGDFLLLPQAPR